MVYKYGKLFKEVLTNEIICASYDIGQNYYIFIQDMLKKGYQQCIVTSDIMVKIMEYFILNDSVEVTSIEFMVEEDELEKEIATLLKSMKKNLGYWNILQKKISFLSENDCIEIKKVDFRKIVDAGSLFSVQVNGIVTVSDYDFDNISTSISKIVKKCIK